MPEFPSPEAAHVCDDYQPDLLAQRPHLVLRAPRQRRNLPVGEAEGLWPCEEVTACGRSPSQATLAKRHGFDKWRVDCCSDSFTRRLLEYLPRFDVPPKESHACFFRQSRRPFRPRKSTRRRLVGTGCSRGRRVNRRRDIPICMRHRFWRCRFG
jgi:hypothetical protein